MRNVKNETIKKVEAKIFAAAKPETVKVSERNNYHFLNRFAL